MTDNELLTDENILRELKLDISLLAEVQYRILQKKVHEQLISLAEDAIENNSVAITSVEDLLTLVELELLLM